MSRFRIFAAALGMGLLPTLAVPAIALAAPPRFANVFADHAVLQRGGPIHVWGTATPFADLKISLNGESVAVASDSAGRWSADLPTQTAGGPYDLTVSDSAASSKLSDIMVGDVYLCSGQSNMQYPVKYATNAWGEVPGTVNSNLRYLNIASDSQPAPLGDLSKPASWKTINPDTTGDASAVCYYMSKAIQARQKVPVGFIQSFWGGTTIQGWISEDSLRTLPAYTAGVDAIAQYAADPEKAKAAQAKVVEAWWDAHDLAAKAQRAWISPRFDDSSWPRLTATASWKTSTADLKDFAGVVWLRSHVTLTADQASKANELLLGPVDTFDTTWVNGQWAGSGSINWVWRDYHVPPSVFKAGENVIVMRVLGSGGLTGNPGMRFVKTSTGEAIPLSVTWAYKTGMNAKGPNANLAVPSAPWDVPTSLSTLYNGMIAPVAPYSIRAVAWYQGESNAGAAKEYRTLLPMLMADWRKQNRTPNLPFLIVQLASFGAVSTQPAQSGWADLREAQSQSVAADPHAGLAVTIDVGDRTDIHPTQKTVVGNRLARAAQTVVYGEPVSPGGPEATSVTRKGDDLVVSFKDTQGALLTYSANTAIGFETCAGETCVYATATVSGDTIVLKGANRPDVTRVRYAWADAPYTNLYSADDLPAVPFQMEVK